MTEIIYCVFALLIGWCSYWAGVERGFKLGVISLKQHLEAQMKKYDEAQRNAKNESETNTKNNV